MIDGIPLPLVELTPWGLTGLCVLLILFGKLVPAVSVRALERQKEHWRDTAEKLRDTNAVQAETIRSQLAIGETVEKVMHAVQDARERGGGQ